MDKGKHRGESENAPARLPEPGAARPRTTAPAPVPAPVRARTFYCSRWGALVRLRLSAVVRPWSMTLGPTSVSTVRVRSVLFPWVREEEHLTYDSISSVLHVAGLIWDGVVIETRGGVNVLSLPWVRKHDAAELARRLREVSN